MNMKKLEDLVMGIGKGNLGCTGTNADTIGVRVDNAIDADADNRSITEKEQVQIEDLVIDAFNRVFPSTGATVRRITLEINSNRLEGEELLDYQVGARSRFACRTGIIG